ncbi:MAG: sensor histidine kinase, partial [Micromonosporaceae bacterium]|nr:sensor histidine kinase [Micromonosporaceae bacterium]
MSKNPSAPGTSSRFAGPARFIRDLPIWTKLGLIMIVPTIATIVVGTAGLLDQVEQASAAERARALTVLSGDAGALVHALQAERAAAVTLLSSPQEAIQSATAAYTAQHEATQQAQTRFLTTWSTITDVPANFRSHLERVENQLGQLTPLRQQVTALNQVSMSVAEARYEELISDLLEIRTFSAQLTGNTSLGDRIRAAHAVAMQKEFLARETVLVAKALITGEFSTAERNAYVLAVQNARQAENEFRSVATPTQIDYYERVLTGAILRDVLQLEGSLDGLQPNELPANVINPAEWQRATSGRAELLYQIESELNSQALNAAETQGAAVQRRVLVETGVLLLTLLVGVLFAWLVARSMARSLRDLRQGALAVAKFGLPQAVAKLKDPSLSANLSPAGVALQIAEPLPVRSNDEFGQVTEAFNAVHLEAVRTAAEQAALRASVAQMFVNLARRSQILVDRLIGHLDRLERGEQDPDRLSELFQLDHLATRMRRNDENLLVLAGADSTRVQREPAALIDVLRAAQSEVEQYTRVELTAVDPDIEIAAHAVNDLVHMIAELFDNATSFSPPDTVVRVEARRSGDRVLLRVEDRGIGMTAEQYAELNERLATPPDVDVTVSRMMGLVVVARLANRHGVTVTLQPAPQAGPQRGTLAEVVLPSGVLVPRALAGRAHTPTGFPAVRPEPTPVGAGSRSPFGPPLALESGPRGPLPAPSLGATEPATGGVPVPAFGGGGGPSVGAPPPFGPPSYEAPSAPEPAPAFGAAAGGAVAGAAAGGLGAAVT